MFNIPKFYYMSLDYRKDRHTSMETACALCGIPYEIIERYPARLGNEYVPDQLEEVIEKMADDGFPEWRYYLEQPEEPTMLASYWTKVSLLRHISEGGENAFFFSDTFLPYGFRYHSLLPRLSGVHDLKVLFLQLKVDALWIDNPYEFRYIVPSNTPGIYKYPHALVAPAVVFTPEGASELLSSWRTTPQHIFFQLPYFNNLFREMEGLYASIPVMAMSTLR